jgi:hypothetical protein
MRGEGASLRMPTAQTRVKRRAELPASRLPSSTEPSMLMFGVMVLRPFVLVTFIWASK